MTWEFFGATMIFSLVGYLIGSISFSIIASKLFFKEDVRSKGSGNAGATNTLRAYGKKVALGVFVLDILKPIWAALIAYYVKEYTTGFLSGTVIQIAAFAALVGHIFPIYFKFKGGKGAACLLGLFVLFNWTLFFIGLAIFTIVVKKSKIVSVGSILSPFLLLLVQISFMWIPHMNDTWANPITQGPYVWVDSLVLAVAWVVVTAMHWPNIKRLLNGTERKLGSKA